MATRGRRATLTMRDAAGRQHADLARADDGAGAQQRLATGDIGPGIGHELTGGSGAADFDRAMSRRLRVLDHHDGVCPARHRTAGRDRCGRSRQYRPRRRGAAGDHFVVQHHADRRGLACGSKIGGTHRKAIDIGAVERRHVDRRHHILSERAAERVGERACLRRHGTREQGGFETRQRILTRQDRQELVLLATVAILWRGRIGHSRTHISPATYRHRPGCLPQILPSRLIPPARLQRGRSPRAAIRPPPAWPTYPASAPATRFRRCRR